MVLDAVAHVSASEYWVDSSEWRVAHGPNSLVQERFSRPVSELRVFAIVQWENGCGKFK
jgi:hypothetical protein